MLILASETDAAARNIRDHLLTLWTHEEIKVFEGYPMYRSQSGNVTLATIPSPALMFDNPHLSIFPTITSPPFPPPLIHWWYQQRPMSSCTSPGTKVFQETDLSQFIQSVTSPMRSSAVGNEHSHPLPLIS